MEKVLEQTWLTKFRTLPIDMKIVSLWLYIGSVNYWFSFLFHLMYRLSIDPISLILGIVFWEIASGLVDRNNRYRIFALLIKGIGTVRSILIFTGYSIPIVIGSDPDFVVTIGSNQSYLSGSLIKMLWGIIPLMNIFTVVVLLLPQTRKLFSKTAPSNVLQTQESREV
jgi:hypothetical protein